MAQTTVQRTSKLVGYQNDQLARLRDKLTRAISTGDVEAVHDLRVASRRLNCAIEVAETRIGRKRVGRARRSLKRVRQAFREVRDLDVLRLSLSESPIPEMLEPTTLAHVEAVLSARRERGMAAVRKGGKRAKLLARLAPVEALIDDFARFAEREPARIEEHLGDMLQQRARALLEQDPREQATDLHRTRIRLKKLRYCAQLLSECECLGAPDLIAELTQMQTLLGNWSDHLVAARTLGRIAAQRKLIAAHTAVSDHLFGHAAARARTALEDRRRILEQWSSLAAVITKSVPGLANRETAGEETGGPVGVEAEATEGGS